MVFVYLTIRTLITMAGMCIIGYGYSKVLVWLKSKRFMIFQGIVATIVWLSYCAAFMLGLYFIISPMVPVESWYEFIILLIAFIISIVPAMIIINHYVPFNVRKR